GKIAFLQYTGGDGRVYLQAAEKHLLRALDIGFPWPPRIVQFLEADGLPAEGSILASEVLDIDGDRKKAINLLAKVYKIRSKEEGRVDLRPLCKALLL